MCIQPSEIQYFLCRDFWTCLRPEVTMRTRILSLESVFKDLYWLVGNNRAKLDLLACFLFIRLFAKKKFASALWCQHWNSDLSWYCKSNYVWKPGYWRIYGFNIDFAMCNWHTELFSFCDLYQFKHHATPLNYTIYSFSWPHYMRYITIKAPVSLDFILTARAYRHCFGIFPQMSGFTCIAFFISCEII